MLKSYIPLEPKPIGLRALIPFLFHKFYANLCIVMRLFIPFHEQVEPPEKDLPSSGQLVEEQRRQCKEIFDLSESRLSGLSSRASSLFSTVGLLAPLELAAIGFAWKHYSSTGEMPSAVYWMFIASLVLLTLAGVAVIRASNLITVEQPGIASVIDTDDGTVRSYDSHRDAMCMLWCAMANNAIANRRFDHIRAGTNLVVLSVSLLLAGAITLSTIPPGELRSPHVVDSRLNSLESDLHALENAHQVFENRLESIVSQILSIKAEKCGSPVPTPDIGGTPGSPSAQPGASSRRQGPRG